MASSTTIKQPVIAKLMDLVFEHRETMSNADYLEMSNALQTLHRRAPTPRTIPIDNSPPHFPPTPLPVWRDSVVPNRFMVSKPTPWILEITKHRYWIHDLTTYIASTRLKLIDKVIALYELLEDRGIQQPPSLDYWSRKPTAYYRDALVLCSDVPPSTLKRLYESVKERRLRYDHEVRAGKVAQSWKLIKELEEYRQ